MAQTPDTNGSAYCTPAQMLTFHDAQLIGQLVSDVGTPVSAPSLLSNATLALLLSSAAGQIETACTVGGRYRAQDLLAMAQDTGSNGAAYLAELNAHLAFGKLRQRRGYRTEDEFPEVKEARETLERLRLGERILPFDESEQAGVGTRTDQSVCNPRRYLPLSTTTARRYFGVRDRSYSKPPGGCGYGC